MTFKRWLGLFNLLIITALISSCGCTKEEVEELPIVNDDLEEVEEVSFKYHYPLTGVATNDDVSGRAVAVVVNNQIEARPQSGLHKADIVYEVMTEGNITRFLAIFQSERPENIGPVRSARNYFIELAKGYDSLFIAHGYSPEALEMLQSGYIDELNGMNYDGSLFKRASFRRAPHNSYITFDNILKGGKAKNYDMTSTPESNTFLTEEQLESLNGEPMSKMLISYSSPSFNVRFDYDESIEKYTRHSKDEQTADYDTDEPVLLDNIFIVETDHRVVDYEGRLAIDLSSGGKGYLLQKGLWREVEWENRNGKIVPVENGELAPFLQGKTWINIIGKDPGLNSSVTIE